ncbi:hypothetical protein BDF20DRAFT_836654 [Mycotypha africana]|uniref:uncharacterized protein n=1 Tax=Mycotypha africana TaxID=64632 RepID=UPI002300077A|nr:uncharacterized protein BDF20DRAFT_836654 [Mycotypha africana]KAI8975233.1 hypothetical protein BDF20DRAFT_836654 [Mycotypha africana]
MFPNNCNSSNEKRGSIFVSGTDGDKGVILVQQLLQLPEQYKHLTHKTVYAGLPDSTTPRARSLEGLGAKVVAFDVLNDHKAAFKALSNVSKLCLLIDPLSERMQRSNAYLFGKALNLILPHSFIDAAKDAQVEHVIFLTPFTPLDPVKSITVNKQKHYSDDTTHTLPYNSYRTQFMLIESYLQSQFDHNRITILRYPGLLHQHLLVFSKYIAQHNAFPLPHQHLEITVESCNMIDIARATAFVAHSPTLRHSKNTYKISSGLLTLEEMSHRVLIGGLQKRNCTINTMDMIELQKILSESVGNEDHAMFLMEMWGLPVVHNYNSCGSRRLEMTRDLEALTGQSGKTLNEYFEEDGVRDAFLSHHSVTAATASVVTNPNSSQNESSAATVIRT